MKAPCLAIFSTLLLVFVGVVSARAQTNLDGTVAVPIYVTNSANYSPSHYTIYAAIGGGPLLPYLFDTGAPNFFSFYNTNGAATTTNGSFTFSTGLTYYYEGITSTVSLGSNNATLVTSDPLNLAQVRYTQNDVFNNTPIHQVTNAAGPQADGTYGDFGAGFYGSSLLATVLTQIPLSHSLTLGYTLNLTTKQIASSGQGSLTLGVSASLLASYATNPNVIKMALSPTGSTIPTAGGGSVAGYNKAQVSNVIVSLTASNGTSTSTNMPFVLDTGGGPNAVLYATNLDAFNNATNLTVATTNIASQTLYTVTDNTTPWGGSVDVLTNLAGGVRLNSGGYFFESNIVTFDLSSGTLYIVPVQAVPEPSSWALLLGCGVLLLGLGMYSRGRGAQRFLLFLAPLATLASLHAQSDNPLTGYTGYTNSYFLNYANDPNFGTANPDDPRVNFSIGGGDFTVNLDTGSRGLYLSTDLLGNHLQTNADSFSGQVYLNSSARIFEGIWTTTQVDFSVTDQNGQATTATATIPVLDVTTLACSTNPQPGQVGIASTTFSLKADGPIVVMNADGSTFITNATGSVTLFAGQSVSYTAGSNASYLAPVSNFGVGFDRTGQGTTPNTNNINQSYNAFLNLSTMTNGSMVAGYILKTNGIQLGLTASTTNFAYTQLLPTGLTNDASLHTVPDWQAPTGTLVEGGQTNATGQVVVDIGIGHAIMTLPGQTNGYLTNPALGVDLLNSGGAVGYNITTNPANLLNPQFQGNPGNVSLFPPLDGNFSENQSPTSDYFFNTGRNVLNAFDFLYDGQNGFVGLTTNGLVATNADLSFTAAFYPNPVPEPSEVWLFVLGGVVLFGYGVFHRGRPSQKGLATPAR